MMTAKSVAESGVTSKEIDTLSLDFLDDESLTTLVMDEWGTPDDWSDLMSLAGQIEIYQPGEKAPSKKKIEKRPVSTYHKSWQERKAAGAKHMLYFIHCSGTVHLFRSKALAELKAKELDRGEKVLTGKSKDGKETFRYKVETQRTLEYFWMLKPGRKLIAHDMIHEHIAILLDGSLLITLRPKREIESIRPISYTPEIVREIRARFPQQTPLSIAVKNRALVAYILDCLDISYAPSELIKFQNILTRVFNLQLGKTVLLTVPEPPPMTSKLTKRKRKSSRLLGPR